jgi:F-type H+-transporting ATPase subunit alpha
VFYLHSRLLERACKYSKENGGGSLTALPIIETQAGDLSAYIPTNVISITDGQIFVEADLFNAGQRPALNVGSSVSRVGSSAQTKAMRKVAGRLKLELAQYRSLEAFAQFGTSELDKATRMQLERGRRITEVLKQPLYSPVPVENQVMVLYAAINSYLDDVPVDKITTFETSFLSFMETNHPEIGKDIVQTRELKPEIETSLKNAILEFKKGYMV